MAKAHIILGISSCHIDKPNVRHTTSSIVFVRLMYVSMVLSMMRKGKARSSLLYTLRAAIDRACQAVVLVGRVFSSSMESNNIMMPATTKVVNRNKLMNFLPIYIQRVNGIWCTLDDLDFFVESDAAGFQYSALHFRDQHNDLLCGGSSCVNEEVAV